MPAYKHTILSGYEYVNINDIDQYAYFLNFVEIINSKIVNGAQHWT